VRAASVAAFCFDVSVGARKRRHFAASAIASNARVDLSLQATDVTGFPTPEIDM